MMRCALMRGAVDRAARRKAEGALPFATLGMKARSPPADDALRGGLVCSASPRSPRGHVSEECYLFASVFIAHAMNTWAPSPCAMPLFTRHFPGWSVVTWADLSQVVSVDLSHVQTLSLFSLLLSLFSHVQTRLTTACNRLHYAGIRMVEEVMRWWDERRWHEACPPRHIAPRHMAYACFVKLTRKACYMHRQRRVQRCRNTRGQGCLRISG